MQVFKLVINCLCQFYYDKVSLHQITSDCQKAKEARVLKNRLFNKQFATKLSGLVYVYSVFFMVETFLLN